MCKFVIFKNFAGFNKLSLELAKYSKKVDDVLDNLDGVPGWRIYDTAVDGKPFPILSYGNGKGFMELEVNQTVIDKGVFNWTAISRDGGSILTDDITGRFTYLQPSGIPLNSETHGADDVGIWAGGPMAHLFHGVHQQTHIGNVMSLAGCIGPHKDYPR